MSWRMGSNRRSEPHIGIEALGCICSAVHCLCRTRLSKAVVA